MVLSFYSNEQSFDTIESLQETVNEIIGTGVDYMNTFLSVSCVETIRRVYPCISVLDEMCVVACRMEIPSSVNLRKSQILR